MEQNKLERKIVEQLRNHRNALADDWRAYSSRLAPNQKDNLLHDNLVHVLDTSNELLYIFELRMSHVIPELATEWKALEQLVPSREGDGGSQHQMVNPLDTYAEQQCQCIIFDPCPHHGGVGLDQYFIDHNIGGD
jgi:hypothetical protein